MNESTGVVMERVGDRSIVFEIEIDGNEVREIVDRAIGIDEFCFQDEEGVG